MLIYEVSTVGNASDPSCSEVNRARTSTGTNDDNKPGEAEGKVDIMMSDKINKTSILVNC